MRKKKEKIKINIDISILDKMIAYIFTNNANASKKTLVNMRELLFLIDENIFDSDRQLEVRFFMLKKLLEGRLTKRIEDFQMLGNYILGGQFDEEINEIFIDLDNSQDLSNDEIIFIDEYISDRLTYGFIYQYDVSIEDKLLELRNNTFNSLSEFNESFEEVISELNNKIKRSKSVSRYASRDFNTEIESLDIALTQTMTNLKKPSSKIKSGLQYLNKMLYGGFEAGRVYLFLGMAKG